MVRHKIAELWGADLRSLAAFRIGLALLLLADLINRASDLRAHYTDFGVLPRSAALALSPSIWHYSLYFWTGTPLLPAVGFLLAGLFALGLLLGYRTRVLTGLSWMFLLALHVRNPLILQGGDILLRLLLFWGMFVPLGARYSLDSALNLSPDEVPERVLSMGTAALLLQVIFMYEFTALHKSGAEWWSEGSAVYYALSLARLAKPSGLFLLHFPSLLQLLTYAVIWFEVLGPLLLFTPVCTGPIRTALVCAFCGLQLGFGLCLALGLFPWVSAVAMLPFVPTWFWDKLFTRLRTPDRMGVTIYYDGECGFCKKLVLILWTFLLLPGTSIRPAQEEPLIHKEMKAQNSWVVVDQQGVAYVKFAAVTVLCRLSPLCWFLAPVLAWRPVARMGQALYEIIATHRAIGATLMTPFRYRPLQLRPSRLTTILAAFLLLYIFVWNLCMFKASPYHIPTPLHEIGTWLRLQQRWAMFAPRPPQESGWYVIPGTLRDGRQIDLFTDGGAVRWDKPGLVSAAYKNQRWSKYLRILTRKKNSGYRLYYAQYLCRYWNTDHEATSQLAAVQIYFMGERTLPTGHATPHKVLLWQQECVSE